MEKIELEFIKKQYQSGIKNYSDFTKEVGLWASEKYIYEKHVSQSDQILDLGCGTGRTTFPLNKMGYKNIIGVDLTPEMIFEAQKLNKHFGVDIDFRIGNALHLEFKSQRFDTVIFSFNGIMSIPSQVNRNKALKEIYRVLKNNGYFIFTTHDREKELSFLEFWKEEKEKWRNGEQNQFLFEYGDIITSSKNESRDIFIHIPNQKEIEEWLILHGFEVIETFYRSDKFDESENVKAKSGECRFWVAQKKE